MLIAVRNDGSLLLIVVRNDGVAFYPYPVDTGNNQASIYDSKSNFIERQRYILVKAASAMVEVS